MESAHASADAEVVATAADPSSADEPGADGLTRRDREILTFERQWWKYAGVKEDASRISSDRDRDNDKDFIETVGRRHNFTGKVNG